MPSLVSPVEESAKPAPAPKLRRKLQKVKRPESLESNEASGNNSANINEPGIAKISLPLLPDLSSSKWSEYLRADLYSLPQPSESHKSPATTGTYPELSHLGQGLDTPRSSSDTLGSGSSTDASAETRRRRAKTPVFQIGQLEAKARARKLKAANQKAADMTKAMEDEAEATPARLRIVKETAANAVPMRPAAEAMSLEGVVRETASEKQAVDPVAEAYRALIGTEDSIFTDSRPVTPRPQPHSRHDSGEGLSLRRQHRSSDLRRESREFEHPAEESPQGSPTSDGTLVAFEEETIYFKPMSPLRDWDSPMASPLPTPSNIGLKICVDLLTKDLTSAVTRNERRPQEETSALKIWTMIEGYEELRDKLMHSGLRYDEVLSLQQSFDTWLKALYAAHDRLTGADRASESEYELEYSMV